MDQNLGKGLEEELVIDEELSYAWRAYNEAVKLRPVPAIEKPLGPRGLQETEEPVVLIDNLDLSGLRNWNDQNPWQY